MYKFENLTVGQVRVLGKKLNEYKSIDEYKFAVNQVRLGLEGRVNESEMKKFKYYAICILRELYFENNSDSMTPVSDEDMELWLEL